MIGNLTLEVINAADLPGERQEYVFVILRERLPLIADQTDPAINMGRRRYGRSLWRAGCSPYPRRPSGPQLAHGFVNPSLPRIFQATQRERARGGIELSGAHGLLDECRVTINDDGGSSDGLWRDLSAVLVE